MSKYLRAIPDDLIQIFEQIDSTPDSLTVDNEVDLLALRIYELIKENDYPVLKLWVELKKKFDAYKRARKKGDVAAGLEALSEFDGLLSKGIVSSYKWDEIMRLIETRRKMIDTHTKSKLAEQEMMSMEAVRELITIYGKKISDVIRDKVPDKLLQESLAEAIIEVEIE